MQDEQGKEVREDQPKGPHGHSFPERLALVKGYLSSQQPIRDYCAQAGISTTTLCVWKKNYKAYGEEGLRNGTNQRNPEGKTGMRYAPDKRREVVEAFRKSGMTREDFSKTWGVRTGTLRTWLRAFEEKGPMGLDRPWLKAGHRRKRKNEHNGVREAIEEVKNRFPSFGLRKVQDFLGRFRGLKVSTRRIKRAAAEAGLGWEGEKPRRRYRRRNIQRFERSTPNQLWQSDITSFVLTRHSQRVYLVAFMDDFSRYIVGWGLHFHQKSEMVVEAMQDGIARFGKPREVLTDQGRQYFSWRGRSDFQRRLKNEGIWHVVARTHHPQTCGKIERFWETVRDEFWGRVQPQEMPEARERLSHFIAHYNHFRPHQGIDGMVPADRFFGVESQVREALEKAMNANELLLATGEEPRKPVFLVGQIGDQPVSLHGERGKLVLHTPQGVQEVAYDAIGIHQTEKEADHETGREQGAGAGTQKAQAEEGADQDAQEVPVSGESVMGSSSTRGQGESASDGSGAPGGVAGTDQPGGRGEEAGHPDHPPVADEPAGRGGNGGRTLEAATDAGQHAGLGERPGAGEAGQGTGAQNPNPAGAH